MSRASLRHVLNNNHNEASMAIYHLSAKIISRGKGRNSVAAAAYRRAQRFFDEQLNRTWNYENKLGVVHSEISVPPTNAPAWIHNLDSSKLWNLVERSEKRIDSQLAREVEFSLPIELDQYQAITLAREFISDQFTTQGMIADWSVHWDNPENPHVHVMLTMRSLTESGFGQKVVAWNCKSLLVAWREKWAEYANFHLKLHQHNVRIDHRSYKDQGIDLIPTVHRGYACGEMQKQGQVVDRLLNEEQTKILNLTKIDEVLKRVEKNYSVFGDKELKKTLATYTKNYHVIHALIEKIKSQPTVMLLGIGEDGEEKYTTKRIFELENKIQQCSDRLQGQYRKPMTQSFIDKQLSAYEKLSQLMLTEEQREAVIHMMQTQSLSCVIGRAGSGKSFTLGAAKHVWEKKRLRVRGITISGIAAANLQKESNIPSQTIASFKYAIRNAQITLNKNDVIVMDEAGMTDSELMAFVLDEIQKAKAKIVLVGDPQQLQPIGSGPIFRAILERTGFAEINRIYRQTEAWQREATKNLAMGKTDEALKAYDTHHCIHFDENLSQTKSSTVRHWLELRKNHELSEILVLTHRNADVKDLNQLIRQQRINAREIEEGILTSTEKGDIYLSAKDRILFTKNDKKLGVKNGQFGTVESIDNMKISIKTDAGKLIAFDPFLYPYFTHGYAATVHKAQGVSVKHSLVCVTGTHWDRHLSYVALSRHKESCHIFTDKLSYKNLQVLSEQLSIKPLKDSTLDYPVNFSKRYGIDNESILEKLHNKISEKWNILRERNKSKDDLWLDKVLKTYVDYHVEQSKLVALMHSSYSRPKDGKDYSAAPTENLKRIREYAAEASKSPQFETALQKTKGLTSLHFKDRYSFEEMQKKIQKNELPENDKLYLIRQIHSTAREYERKRNEKLSQNQGLSRKI